MATSYTEATDSEALFIGARSKDFSGYPDCYPAFFDAFQNVNDVGTKPETEVELKAPFVERTDLDASLTDFTVAAHMEVLEVDHILTYDRHYDAFDVTTLPYRDRD